MKQLDDIQEHATVDLMQNKFCNLISKIRMRTNFVKFY